MYVRLLLVLFVCGCAVASCPPCHVYSNASQQCVQVPPMTDPNGDCGMELVCGVRAVCGIQGHCVLERPPRWDNCYPTTTTTSTILSLPTPTPVITSPSLKATSAFPPPDDDDEIPVSDIGLFIMTFFCLASFCVFTLSLFSFYERKKDTNTPLPVSSNMALTRLDFFHFRRPFK